MGADCLSRNPLEEDEDEAQCVNLVKLVVFDSPVFVTKGLLSSGRGPMSRGSWCPWIY